MLDALFRPRSVAIVGASNNPLSIGHIVLQNLLDHNFKGPIFPVNPKSKYIKTFKAYPSVSAIPDEVDLVNISVKNTLVPAILEDCGQKGVKFAIVHTAGFKEVGEEGLALEKQIVDIAHKYGMRIYGPNSQGIQNSDPEVSVYANFTFVPMFEGNISIVAQSGGVGETLKLHLYRIGKGIRMYSSFGNEADVSMNEIIDYYGQDEGTRAIMVHIETLKDPAGFLEVAQRVTPKKPILALKSGKTTEGIRAVASHTGSMIEQDTLADAIFEKAGVLRFHSQEEMIDAAVAFSSQPVPKGDRVCIVTNTGGPAIIAVDECMAAGLQLAELSSSTIDTLKQLVFKEAIVSNPVDVVATAGPDQYGGTVAALLEDPQIDSLLLVFVTAPFVDCEGIAAKLGELGKTASKPIVCQVITIEKWQKVIDIIRGSGVPVYDYAETAAKALSAMTGYGAISKRETPVDVSFEIDKEKAAGMMEKYKGKGIFLPQADVFDLLRSYGIPTVETEKISDRAELEEAARKIGFPVVLKVDSEAIIHKSESGGVALGLKDSTSLQTAFEEMSLKFQDHSPAFVLQKFVESGKEVIIGSKSSVGSNPLVVFGLGGIFVEVLKDVQFRLSPLTEKEALEMIQSIRGYSILEGTRGEEGVDIDSLVDILIRFSRLVFDFPEIDECDLNPVFAFPAGQGAEVVDARLKVK
jgi:acyl-CoA synthetase (NDP forming)